MALSVVIPTKNEEKNIADALKELSWADEIIVIDDESTDETKKAAEKEGAIVFVRKLHNNFAEQRNFGLSKTQGEWVLFVDADERVLEPLKEEILRTISMENDISGYYIKREDILWGKKLRYGDVGNIKLLRLAKKNAGKWTGVVHEEWNINGNVGTLNNPLVHYPHPTVAEFLKEINFYSTLRAEELHDQKIKSSFISILLYTKGKFSLNYFLKLGFMDGVAGLVHALIMSFYSFLVRGKLWLLWQKNR